MIKNKWNTLIFLCYLAYCVFFCLLFWFAFDNNDLFYKYYDLASLCLRITFGINTLSQILAIFKKRAFSVTYLVMGIFLLLLTIGFTVGQSV